jgi:hypothetical protein
MFRIAMLCSCGIAIGTSNRSRRSTGRRNRGIHQLRLPCSLRSGLVKRGNQGRPSICLPEQIVNQGSNEFDVDKNHKPIFAKGNITGV